LDAFVILYLWKLLGLDDSYTYLQGWWMLEWTSQT